MTLTGVKKRAKISVTVADGEVIPPSTMVVNGRVGIISQHEVTAMLERSTSYVLPQIRDMYDPPMSKEEREVAVESRNDFGWQPSNTETRNFMLRKENKKAQTMEMFEDPEHQKGFKNEETENVEFSGHLTDEEKDFLNNYKAVVFFDVDSYDERGMEGTLSVSIEDAEGYGPERYFFEELRTLISLPEDFFPWEYFGGNMTSALSENNQYTSVTEVINALASTYGDHLDLNFDDYDAGALAEYFEQKTGKKAQEESVINIADSIDDIQEVANRMTKLFMGIETLQADEYDEDFAVFSTNDPEYFVKVESDYGEVKLELIDSTTNEVVFSKVLEKDFFQDEPDYEEMDYQRRMRGQSFDNTKQQIDNAVGDPEALAEVIASAPDYEEALKYASQQVPDSMEWMKTVRILSDAIEVPGVSGKKAQENSTGSSYEEELKNIKGLIEGLDVSDTEASGRINDMIFDIMERYGINESQVSWDLSRLHPEGIDLVVELNMLWGFAEDLENADSDSYDRLSSYILGSLLNLKEELINQEKYNEKRNET